MNVTPAKAGVQKPSKNLDSDFRRNDGLGIFRTIPRVCVHTLVLRQRSSAGQDNTPLPPSRGESRGESQRGGEPCGTKLTEYDRLMTEREKTAMLAQYIKDKGFQEGRQEGRRIAEILTSNVQQATTDENHGIFHL